jgi:hypothetical protein
LTALSSVSLRPQRRSTLTIFSMLYRLNRSAALRTSRTTVGRNKDGRK